MKKWEIYQEKYRHSKKGVTGSLYHAQRSSAKIRQHKPPNYSLQEFRKWCYSQGKFHTLYNAWVFSGYKKNSKPSTDRINPKKTYTFDNIQILTYYENNYKNGKFENNREVLCQRIIQKTIKGKTIKIWIGIRPTARKLKITPYYVRQALKGKILNGYIWERIGKE